MKELLKQWLVFIVTCMAGALQMRKKSPCLGEVNMRSYRPNLLCLPMGLLRWQDLGQIFAWNAGNVGRRGPGAY